MSECAYYRGTGHCTEQWRNCAFYGEPKCVTDEPYPMRDARGRFTRPPAVPTDEDTR